MEDNTIKDKEIYAIDRNMMKTFEQNKLATSPAYSYINRAGKRVSFPNASITKNINNKKKQEILTEDDVYSESIKGKQLGINLCFGKSYENTKFYVLL